jgi:two-component system, cell cycle sensor histidine kinase and response regulator CckA
MDSESGSPAQPPDRDRSRQGTEVFRRLVEHSLGLMCVHDLDGNLLFVNPAAAESLGFSPEQGTGSNLRSFLSPSVREEFDAYLQRIRDNAEDSGLMRLVARDGTERIWMYRNVLHEEPGMSARVLGHAIDVTDRVRAERALRESERRRIESLGVLAGGLAHEFDNLLSVIVGRSHSLFERFRTQEPARRDLDSIQRAAQRAATLIQQLLAFARKQPFRPQPSNLNQLVTGLSLSTVIPARVELSLRLAESLRPASADPGQIQRAMLHLVENACDAMPAGGRLVLETANVDLDEAFVETHPGAHPGPHVRLTVRDTSDGMDEVAQSRAFEPFFSAGRGPEGGHLGLAAVYGITKQHGGYITVESQPGRGTTFTLYLPARAEASSPVGETPSRGPRGPEGTETVLLVEEEEAVRLLLRDILQLHGYHVVEAGDPQAALALASGREEPIHLLLTDVSMMKMSGPALADRLIGTRPGVKVLYMSGYTAEALGRQGVLGPGAALLEKPFTMMTLLGKVRDVLDG